VQFAYIKGTDGGGPAVVPADAFVAGARSVGIPAGLYHYAQLLPSPETQADVLHAEVRRLAATGLPPALDIEGPFHTAPLAAAVVFAQRFLTRLRGHGYDRVTLYANTGFLGQLRPDAWHVPGLLIWAANYGPNDGTRHALSYTGQVDIHQYTDRGRLSGIPGYVDLNESLSDIQEDTMSWGEDLTVLPGTPGYDAGATLKAATMLADVLGVAHRLEVNLAGLDTRLAAIQEDLPQAMAAAVVAALPAGMDAQAFAQAVTDRVAAKLA
jgi:hypothetical protein